MKLYDNELLRCKFSAFKNIRDGKFAYPTPEFCQILSKGMYSTDDLEKIKHKSDIFMLGLTLLEICTIENSETLFTPKEFIFNNAKLEERLRLASRKYS